MVTKPTKPPSPPSSRSSSLSAHLAVVELKQRILTSLSRLSDRDTHQIAVEDLEAVIQTISPDAFSIILNSLYDATNDTTKNKPAVKKEAIRLLAFFCATHTESAASHLTKIITHIVKRLKDPDSGVKDACRESIGHLSFLYLKDSDSGDNNIGSLVLLFVKPLFDAMNEQNKAVQAGAASCMAKMVEMASDPPVLAFQKLCSRICKLLNSPNFMANSALLPVVSRLSQVSAISPQFLEPLLQCINDCLSSSDWSTRKSAADTLIVFALHSSNLIKVKPTSTITMLETCRFDKIKPVRDSITEALQLWNQIAERCEDLKLHNHVEVSEPIKSSRKDLFKLDVKKTKKKTPHLIDKEQNPEFFQRLETRVSGEVEILFPKSSNPQNEVEPGSQSQSKSKSKSNEPVNSEKQDIDPSLKRQDFCNQGNLLGIQRQLLQLERQQNYIMNMLHDFKGGSRDDMATLENRVRGLEKVVDDMARGFSSMSTYSQTYSQPYSQRGRNYTIRKYNVRDRGNLWDHKHGQIRSTRGLTKGVGPGPSTYRAMDGVCNGDMDTAFSEVLSTGDDFLLVKLMDRVGPVVDQLSGDVASEVLHAVAQFLPEASLVDICLSWIQQLLDMISENGADVVGIHVEVKREILVRLNENLSIIEPPQDWEGLMPHQLLLELASAWNINPQQLHK